MPDRRGFLVVSLTYQIFTLSDGALRMLVLLHLHAQGQTAWALALMLVPYEIAGVITNLGGGWLGARLGQKPVLLLGLALQVTACLLLTVAAVHLTIGYVMLTQVLSGIAKDLAKTAAKSFVRTLEPTAAAGPLFAATAWLTGSKNTVKGLGFFAGGVLLATLGFRGTNLALAGLLASMLLFSLWHLPRPPGRAGVRLRAMFTHPPAVHWLALARLFLFGSRDAWFAIALPLFLSARWGWSSIAVGGFLAAWIIGYGLVQALTPRLLRARDLGTGVRHTTVVTFALLLPLVLTFAALHFAWPDAALLAGLLLYGVVFALGSSLHSWLVVAIDRADTTPERVGYYYAANAVGRLGGLLLSGWLYTRYAAGDSGLGATLIAAGGAVVLAGLAVMPARNAVE